VQPGLRSSRRSLSIYSEGQAIPVGEDDPKKFQWRYRVKNREYIPDFFPVNMDNFEVSNDKGLRYSTPEKLTYHLPKEEQHHDIQITFIGDLLKDKTVNLSEEKQVTLRSQH
jgi:hypothetical protein